MIKTNELRICNYIDVINRSREIHMPFGIIKQVGSIDFFKVKLYDYDKPLALQADNWEVDINDLSPISLTEEWLVKLGFSDEYYKNGYIGIDVGSTDFVLSKPVNESESITDKYFTFHCDYGGWKRFKSFEYVHDLQNFFFALTGEELTIK